MRSFASLFCLVALLAGGIGNAHAEASLSFSPQRVVLEGHTNTTTLRLSNSGDKPATFRVSLSDVIYADDGSVKHVAAPPPGFPSARPFVRFSPSQVRLNPGEAQNVRILLQSPQSIPDGEYRIHAVMAQQPEPAPIDANPNGKTIKATIGLSQSVAIPIIVRRGEGSAQGGIASAQRAGNGVKVMLTRSGNFSLYTDIEVLSGSTRVGYVRGVAVPVPNQRRSVDVEVSGGRPPYTVVVKDNGSGEVIAQKNVQ